MLSSISFLSQKYDELNKADLQVQNETLTTSKDFLSKQVKKLAIDSQQHEESYDDLEQYGRHECIEIRGIPQTIGEDTNKIIVSLILPLKTLVTQEIQVRRIL